jgi:hypothetical protein
MDFQTNLLRLGLNSYRTTAFVPIPTGGQQKIPVGKTMPTNVGRIWGMSIYADTIGPNGETLITTTQAQNLYLTFKDSSTEFFETVRLDEMLFNFAGVPTPSGQKWLPVNLPGQFDLSTSFIQNPTLIASPAPPVQPIVIPITIWFISYKSNAKLLNEGFILDEVENLKGKITKFQL